MKGIAGNTKTNIKAQKALSKGKKATRPDLSVSALSERNVSRTSQTKVLPTYSNLTEYLNSYEIRSRKSLGRNFRVRDFFYRISLSISRLPWKKWLTFLGALTFRSFAVFLIAVIVYGVTPGVLSAPKSFLVTTRSDWEKGTFNQISSTSATDSIQLQPSGNWGARVWAPTPEPVNAGNASVSVGIIFM